MALSGPSLTCDLWQALPIYVEEALAVGLGGGNLEVNRLVYSEGGHIPRLTERTRERSRICQFQLETYIAARASIEGISCRSSATVAEIIVYMMRGYYAGAMLSGEAPSPEACRKWTRLASRTILSSRDEC